MSSEASEATQYMMITENTNKMPPKFAFNYPVLKSKNGVLKLIELVIEIVCLNILVTGEFSNLSFGAVISISFVMLCFLSTSVITSILLVSHLMSPMAESVLPKTIFELVSNVAAFLYFMTSSMALLITVTAEHHENPTFQQSVAVAIIGVICFLIFFVSQGPITGAEIARMILFIGNISFLHTTFLLLLSMLISPMTANMLPKTVFEFMYHLLGCAFYLMTGLAVFALSLKEYSIHPYPTSSVLTGVFGLINSILYLLSTHYSFKSFKE